MSDESKSQIEAIKALDIGQLRRAAKLLGISSERSWTKEEFELAKTCLEMWREHPKVLSVMEKMSTMVESGGELDNIVGAWESEVMKSENLVKNTHAKHSIAL